MKRTMFMITALVLLAFPRLAAALDEGIIESTLLDHVSVNTQFVSGETRLALLDSVVKIGSQNGSSILDLQLGFSGNTAPEPGEASAANFLVGGFLKVSTFLKDKINFPEQWEFLRAIEHGVAYSYDFREKEDFVSYQVGLAFNLQPIQ